MFVSVSCMPTAQTTVVNDLHIFLPSITFHDLLYAQE
jgi:hypothetical protein